MTADNPLKHTTTHVGAGKIDMIPTIREVIETALSEQFGKDDDVIPVAAQHVLEALARWGYGVAPIDVILPPIEDQ